MKLFVEVAREERRLRRGRSKVADVLWYSSCYDYKLLRIAINLPVGFLLSYAVFQLGWKRLNFADFSDFHGSVFEWSTISGSAVAFALSPVFRCSLLCVITEVLGKSGQGLLSIFVAEQLSDGPIENILYNFEMTSNMIVCELELQARVTAQRITLASGPLEALLEKHFGKTTSISQQVARQLESLLEPFEHEITGETTDEDAALVASLSVADVLAAREAIFNAENYSESTPASNPSRWKEYKSKGARSVARRLLRRCQQIFASVAQKCAERFSDIQSKCYSSVPWFLKSLMCDKFNSVELCQPEKMRQTAMEKCKLDHGGGKIEKDVLTPDLEDQWMTIDGISKQLENQMKINLHFKAVEETNDERIRMLSEIKQEIQENLEVVRLTMKAFKEFLSALLILLVYSIFKDVMTTISAYFEDIDFKNVFLTNYFHYIDEKRRILEKRHLEPLTEREIKKHGLLYFFSFPTKTEIKESWQPFLKWIVTVIITFVIILVDFYFYRILTFVVEFANSSKSTARGDQFLKLEVQGEGPVAEMIKELIQFNFTNSIDGNFDNGICVAEPVSPDWIRIFCWIIVPLISMFFLQIVFNYIVKRIIFFSIIGYIFRERSKARTIQLYNRLLFGRINERRLGKARIKFAVEQRQLRKKQKYLFPDDGFIKAKIIDKIFKTGKCLMCEDKFRQKNLFHCDKCPATFCVPCYKDSKNQCYACHIGENVLDLTGKYIESKGENRN